MAIFRAMATVGGWTAGSRLLGFVRDILIANREELLKQSQRFRHTLDALELVIKSGNADALEDLIRTASEGRAGWQLGGGRGSTRQ